MRVHGLLIHHRVRNHKNCQEPNGKLFLSQAYKQENDQANVIWIKCITLNSFMFRNVFFSVIGREINPFLSLLRISYYLLAIMSKWSLPFHQACKKTTRIVAFSVTQFRRCKRQVLFWRSWVQIQCGLNLFLESITHFTRR